MVARIGRRGGATGIRRASAAAFAIAAAVAVLAAIPLTAGADGEPAAGERVRNGFFTAGANDWPSQWKVRAYAGNDATSFSWSGGSSGPGRPDLGFVRIDSSQPDDAAWWQDVAVEPDTWYRVSAWVRIENVGTSAAGASLCVAGPASGAAGNLHGTQPWQPLAFWVRTGVDQHSLALSCRLGSNGSLNTGTVDCAGVSVVESVPPQDGSGNAFTAHSPIARFPWAWPLALLLSLAAIVAVEHSQPSVRHEAALARDEPSATASLSAGRRPIALCLAVVVLFHGVYVLAQLLEQQAGYPLYRQELGADYRSFHQSAEIAASGGDPYDNERLVTPPLSVGFAAPLLGLGFDRAAVAIFWFSIAAVLAAYLLGIGLHLARWPELRPLAIAAGLAILVLSYPVLFLADRGNIDGLVALLVWLGLWLVCGPRYELAGGFALGLAGAIKLYPFALVLPALLRGRFRVVAGIAVAMIAATALHPLESWRFFTIRLWERAATYFRFENTSAMVAVDAAADAVRVFGVDVTEKALKIATLSVFVALLGALAAVEWRRRAVLRSDREADAIGFCCWVPLAVMVPSIVWAYELVNVIPLLPMLAALGARGAQERGVRRAVACAAIGLGLCQVYSYALAQLLAMHVPSGVPAALNAVGLMVLEVGLIAGYAAMPAQTRVSAT